ncbi:MAG: hypothetical protein LBN25_03995 [Christensenellaceae bacterium]|jgi:hypothetical protein|nr:hypothetical protein [Christensenellaceae bacterium]
MTKKVGIAITSLIFLAVCVGAVLYFASNRTPNDVEPSSETGGAAATIATSLPQNADFSGLDIAGDYTLSIELNLPSGVALTDVKPFHSDYYPIMTNIGKLKELDPYLPMPALPAKDFVFAGWAIAEYIAGSSMAQFFPLLAYTPDEGTLNGSFPVTNNLFRYADYRTYPYAFSTKNVAPGANDNVVTLRAYWLVRTSTNYINIATANDLLSVQYEMEGNYKLVNDIDLKNINFTPIGLHLRKPITDDEVHPENNDTVLSGRENDPILDNNYGQYDEFGHRTVRGIEPFYGIFDGNGKTISNLTLTPDAEEANLNYLPYGLFAELGAHGRITANLAEKISAKPERAATVKNLSLTKVRIMLPGNLSNFFIGALAGAVRGYSNDEKTDNQYTGKTVEPLIQNVSVSGSITNPKLVYDAGYLDALLGEWGYANPTNNLYMGGLVGALIAGEVRDCTFNSGSVTSESNSDAVFVGGIAGFTWTEAIEGSYRVEVDDNGTPEDTADDNKKYIYDSTSENPWFGEHNPSEMYGKIVNCFSLATVKGRFSGGLVGYNNGVIEGSQAKGYISGSESYPASAGGLVGYNDIAGKISTSFAEGEVTARTAGGLVGINVVNYSTNSPSNILGAVIYQTEQVYQEYNSDGSAKTVQQQEEESKNSNLFIGRGGTIRDCYSTGNVNAVESGGGLLGRFESLLPVNGTADIKLYISASTDVNVSYGVEKYVFVENVIAYGDVKVVAQVIVYNDIQTGELKVSNGIYHQIYAGGLIGFAHEARVRNAIAAGNVFGVSKRTQGNDFVYNEQGDAIEQYIQYNQAYVSNVIGQSSNQVDSKGNNLYVKDMRNVYGLETQVVTRNDTRILVRVISTVNNPTNSNQIFLYYYQDFNSSPALAIIRANDADYISKPSYYKQSDAPSGEEFDFGHIHGGGMGFSASIWNVRGTDGQPAEQYNFTTKNKKLRLLS